MKSPVSSGIYVHPTDRGDEERRRKSSQRDYDRKHSKSNKKSRDLQKRIPKEATDLKLYMDGIKRLQKRLGLQDCLQ